MEQNNLKSEMVDYIAEENKACFKLQQIDDPVITLDERKQILNETLEQSHTKFLMKFGPYLKSEHSAFFENGQNYTLDEQYQVEFYLNLIKRRTCNDVAVKNRRYEAMKIMIEEGHYFSEIEMMKREPLLYHEFVGQYLTQNDIQKRDRDNNKSFLNLIFATIDHNAAKELKRKQENEILEQDESLSPEYEVDLPKTTSLWGEFDENLPEQQYKAKFPRDVTSITNDQRNFLRSEFISIMHSKFLSGSDKDFDYTAVDLNQNYDNLAIIARDEEDKYFDSENADESPTQHQDTSEDDDLDLFMKTLNKNLT